MAKIYKPTSPGGLVGFDNTKPAYVADDLGDLHGPSSGVITLPLYIDWTPSRCYDLGKPGRLITMYSTVLREARSEKDLADYLCPALLISMWGSLLIPEFIREAWQASHRELR